MADEAPAVKTEDDSMPAMHEVPNLDTIPQINNYAPVIDDDHGHVAHGQSSASGSHQNSPAPQTDTPTHGVSSEPPIKSPGTAESLRHTPAGDGSTRSLSASVPPSQSGIDEKSRKRNADELTPQDGEQSRKQVKISSSDSDASLKASPGASYRQDGADGSAIGAPTHLRICTRCAQFPVTEYHSTGAGKTDLVWCRACQIALADIEDVSVSRGSSSNGADVERPVHLAEQNAQTIASPNSQLSSDCLQESSRNEAQPRKAQLRPPHFVMATATRRYDQFEDVNGLLMPALGALLPQGYRRWTNPDVPWACPMRRASWNKCRHRFGTLAELGSHFSTVHGNSLLRDDGDGYFTRFGIAPEGISSLVVAQSRGSLPPRMALPEPSLESPPPEAEEAPDTTNASPLYKKPTHSEMMWEYFLEILCNGSKRHGAELEQQGRELIDTVSKDPKAAALANLPRRRGLACRRRRATIFETFHQVKAFLIQVTGTQSQVCEECAQRSGPFYECVLEPELEEPGPSSWSNACANCLYSGKPCSLNVSRTGSTGDHDDVSGRQATSTQPLQQPPRPADNIPLQDVPLVPQQHKGDRPRLQSPSAGYPSERERFTPLQSKPVATTVVGQHGSGEVAHLVTQGSIPGRVHGSPPQGGISSVPTPDQAAPGQINEASLLPSADGCLEMIAPQAAQSLQQRPSPAPSPSASSPSIAPVPYKNTFSAFPPHETRPSHVGNTTASSQPAQAAINTARHMPTNPLSQPTSATPHRRPTQPEPPTHAAPAPTPRTVSVASNAQSIRSHSVSLSKASGTSPASPRSSGPYTTPAPTPRTSSTPSNAQAPGSAALPPAAAVAQHGLSTAAGLPDQDRETPSSRITKYAQIVTRKESWESAPGRLRSVTSETPDNIAFSRPYLSGPEPVRVCRDALFLLHKVRAGCTYTMDRSEGATRLCVVGVGKVHVQLEGEPIFVLGIMGLFKIRPGVACTVANELGVDALLHITSILSDV